MRLRLGYDTYSLRSLRWNASQHLDFAAQQELEALQFSTLDVFESLDPEYLARVKKSSDDLGITIDAGIGCICELSKMWNATQGSPISLLEKGIKVAKLTGAKVLRCFMGNHIDRAGPLPLDTLMEATARNLKAVRSQALEAGVKIAIENHKDLQAWQAKQLIEFSGTDFVGATLDIGNPLCLMEHPMTTVEVLGPYALTSHIRDTAVYETSNGAAARWTALGDGSVDLEAVIAKFADLCPDCALHLEIITGRPAYDLPYLQESFWSTFPGMPAKDLARFISLAKKGEPFKGRMIEDPIDGRFLSPEVMEALQIQQKEDLVRSVRFAREALGPTRDSRPEK